MQGLPVVHCSPYVLHKEILSHTFGNCVEKYSSQFGYLFRERLEITVRVSLGNFFFSFFINDSHYH